MSDEVLRYRTEEPTAVEKMAAMSWPQRILHVLTWGILAICLAIWAFVGAIFWIPLMVRQMVVFSISMVPSMLVGKRPEQSARVLRNAVSFYRRGFVVAIEAVTRESVEEGGPAVGSPSADVPLKTSQLINELAWVALIWYVILLALGFIETSPLDMWYWLVGIDWQDTVVRPIAEWVQGLRA